MQFQPTFDSLRKRPVPDWYHDAKLGIFIHWGLYSVPGWAPLAGDISKSHKERGWRAWFEHNSYAEWYLNSLKFETGPTRRYHDRVYGPGFSYDDFAPQFNDAVRGWNPAEWADLFHRVGARYIVLTTKHHDGFALWPTAHPCPRKPGYHAERDLVGELAGAVRERGLRLGLYYSGGLDWTFDDTRIEDVRDVWGTIVQDPEFVVYSVAHWRELIDRYRPSLMWNDIGFPAAADLAELFAYYYSVVPDGVINDRFSQTMPERPLGDGQPGGLPRGPHYDFITPEYSTFRETQPIKWEAVRGIGHSFGYSRDEGNDQLLSLQQLIHLFMDVVSKNGNLLLNIGPMADGTIPENQRQRLEDFGSWLAANGEAAFGTRPWIRAEDQTTDGLPLRYTQSDQSLYVTLLGTPATREIGIVGLALGPSATVRLLGAEGALRWRRENATLWITLPDNLSDAPAYCLKIAPLPEQSAAV